MHRAQQLAHPRDRLERRGLAGAVGADDADDLAFVHLQVHVCQGRRAAVLHAHIAQAQQGTVGAGARVPAAVFGRGAGRDALRLAPPLAEVRRDDEGIVGDLGRGALGDDLALVEHGHPVGELGDDLHVVFDQHHRDAGRAHACDQLDELMHLAGVHAGRGLVEDEQVGTRCQRSRDLEAALAREGKPARGFLARARRGRRTPAGRGRALGAAVPMAAARPGAGRSAPGRRGCACVHRPSRSRGLSCVARSGSSGTSERARPGCTGAAASR